MRKKYSIFIVPDGGHTRQFSLSKRIVLFSASAAILFIGATTILSVDFVNRTVDSHRIGELQAENSFLMAKIEIINESLTSLQEELVSLTEKEMAVRTIFGLPEIDPATRQLGIGGPELLPTEAELSIPKHAAYQTEAAIDRLLAHSSFETDQFNVIYDELLNRKDQLDRTPSILPCRGWWVRGYGIKRDPFTGEERLHAGVDISNQAGTPIVATADGIVSFTGNRGRLGKTVIIDHGSGLKTSYGHVSQYKVKRGQKVKRGDVIALMGSTGISTGPHVHYSVVKDGKSRNPKQYIFTSDYLM